MSTVLITGGTGMIGKALINALLVKGYDIIVLTRQKPISFADPRIRYAGWDVYQQKIDGEAIAQADHLIHLAGAGVAEKRWSRQRKKEITDSRVMSGELLVKAIREIPNHISTVVSASAIGWYGPDPMVPNSNPFREDAAASNDFMGNTCVQWEKSLEPVVRSGKRLVKLRIGIVLSNEGGALNEFMKPLKWRIATILGNGKQVISWIHLDDLVRLFIMAIENEKLYGVYNAVAPQPVSNRELVLRLAKIRKGFYIPLYIPSVLLKLALGEMSIEVLKSATVSSEKVREAGFEFEYPEITGALNSFDLG